MNSDIEELIGKKINNILILRKSGYLGNRKRIAIDCLCPFCNNIFRASLESIKYGRYRSCGCAKTCIGGKHANWKGVGEISSTLFSRIKRNAEERSFPFEITIDEIWDLFLKQNRKCALSGMELSFTKSKRDYNATASLDRIDSNKGYLLNNIQWIHKEVNYMKQQFNNQEFLEWIIRIYNNNTICKQ